MNTFGEYVTLPGLVEENAFQIAEAKEVVKAEVLGIMRNHGVDMTSYDYRFIVKQGYDNSDGWRGITKTTDDAIPWVSVAFKATKTQ